MKKILLFFVLIGIANIGIAQHDNKHKIQQLQKDVNDIQNALENAQKAIENITLHSSELDSLASRSNKSSSNPILGNSGNLAHKTIDISNQIKSLTEEIHSNYEKYRKEPLYTNEKYRNRAFDSVHIAIESIKLQLKVINDSIDIINNTYKSFTDKLRVLYTQTSIDSLYKHSDLVSLNIHKRILGNNYPKSIDALQTLLECNNSLRSEFNEKNHNILRQRLKNTTQCNTTKKLESILAPHKEITDEVNKWINNNKNSDNILFEMISFMDYIHREYNRILDVEYPYLYSKLKEAVAPTSSGR